MTQVLSAKKHMETVEAALAGEHSHSHSGSDLTSSRSNSEEDEEEEEEEEEEEDNDDDDGDDGFPILKHACAFAMNSNSCSTNKAQHYHGMGCSRAPLGK